MSRCLRLSRHCPACLYSGINNIILDGQTLPLSGLYVTIGTGSVPDIAPNTVPDFLRIGDLLRLQNKPEYLNTTMLVTGLVLSVIYVLVVIFSRQSKKKRGYEVQPLHLVIIRVIAFFVAINLFSYWLAMDDGLPIMLILLVILYGIYNFIANRTVLDGISTPWAGTSRQRNFPESTPEDDVPRIFEHGTSGRSSRYRYRRQADGCIAECRYEFRVDAIGACFIGGASAYGGVGTIWEPS